MFILTPGASFNYEPSAKFIDYVQGSIKAKIQLVICLDQLIDSSLPDTVAAPKLYIHDSKRSVSNNYRDAFVTNLKKQIKGQTEVISEIVELGNTQPSDEDDEESNKSQYIPYEHIAYASKGLAAITLTVKDPERTPTSRFDKFSTLDNTEICLCKLSKLLFVLNEAMAQTIVSPDLGVEGQFFGNDGMKAADKQYLK